MVDGSRGFLFLEQNRPRVSVRGGVGRVVLVTDPIQRGADDSNCT